MKIGKQGVMKSTAESDPIIFTFLFSWFGHAVVLQNFLKQATVLCQCIHSQQHLTVLPSKYLVSSADWILSLIADFFNQEI